MKDLPGKRVCVIGLGESGRAAIDLLLTKGVNVTPVDSAESAELIEYAAAMSERGIECHLGHNRVLFDEPTSALDPELVGSVLQVMRELRESGMTMVVVSHEMKFAEEAADHVLFLDQGIVVEEGSPKQVFRESQHERTRTFLARVTQH